MIAKSSYLWQPRVSRTSDTDASQRRIFAEIDASIIVGSPTLMLVCVAMTALASMAAPYSVPSPKGMEFLHSTSKLMLNGLNTV